MTTRDVELSGTLIPKGSTVLAMFGSANRDDQTFDDPDDLRLDRPALRARTLAFGGGNHTWSCSTCADRGGAGAHREHADSGTPFPRQVPQNNGA